MVWLWLHLIAWIILAIVVAIGLLGKPEKLMPWAMTARVLYLVSIVSGIILLLRVWQYNPVGSVIKIILALALIAFIEIAFARKQQQKLNKGLLWTVFICCLVVGIFGLWLAQGRPFV
ncbi:hypothetical protein FC83_GL000081 [Agrilactobacillus composti DSM 18527 = JCM 14202]|uniref:Uncharacterized protein n=1 Tax=Agrilactobacillus composti DSM 18527 = JCM 14202 TaxID=1423734 RepID=A0A0R1XRZ9_9LACO|nr:YisL family protein [Agrilactobacillus composti]KRM32991.1 hypothetical protein FC83_GL000081 [Agrilactobacillus composti DSM 18527 = JCM 14202]